MGLVHKEFRDWLMEEKQLAESSAVQFARRIDQFGRKHGDPNRYSPEEIKEIIGALDISESHHNVFVTAFRHYAEYTDSNISDALHTKKRPKRLPKPIPKKDIDRFCDVIPDTPEGRRDRSVVELLYCGMRVSEVCSLSVSSLLPEEPAILVRGKGDKERIVPISKTGWEYLLKHLFHDRFPDHEALKEEIGIVAAVERLRREHPESPLFLTGGQNRIYSRYVRDRIYKWAEKAGLQNIHPHRFRHSFATHVLDEGLDNLFALKETMGHEDLATTNMYVEVSERGRKNLIAFHPRNKDQED